MTGPATPGQEGPSYEPPPNLPEGWIPQWDAVSKKYYYVQLSTGASQWETPTKSAPTGPTPQATPQQGLEHPYGHPGSGSSQQLEDGSVIVNNADGSQSLRRPDGSVEPLTGDRSLGSDLGQLALKQFLGGKTNSSGGGGGLSALAGSLLGGGPNSSHNQSGGSSSGTSGIAGVLIGSLLGGKKPDHQQPPPQQTNYSSPQNHQQSQGGLMGSLGSMFGGHSQQGSSQGNSYGYSSHGNSNGAYTGTAPPVSYQPSGTPQSSYNPQSQGQHSYSQGPNYSQGPPQGQSYPQAPQGQSYSQGQPQGQSYNSPAPPYGGNAAPQHQYNAPGAQSYGTPSYGTSSPQQQQSFGGIQHQPTYGTHEAQSQQFPPPPNYQAGGVYGAPQHPQQGNQFQQNYSGYSPNQVPGGPPVPTSSYPYGQTQPPPQQSYGTPSYGGQQRY